MVTKIKKHFGDDLSGRTFALWGLAFKPGTDDMREAPALNIIDGLLKAGASVRAVDPAALEMARSSVGSPEKLTLAHDPYEILDGCDALVLVTEWNEYRSPDFELIKKSLREPVVFDGRNVWNKHLAESEGLIYHGIGL